MKKMLFLLTLFTSALNIFGQNWPLESSVWYWNGASMYPQHPLSNVGVNSVSKDTFILGFQCKKVGNSSGFVICDSGTTQLFKYELDTDSLYPWLDFSASNGDTVQHTIMLNGVRVTIDFRLIDSLIVVNSVVEEFVALSQEDTLYHFKRLNPIYDQYLDSLAELYPRPNFDYVDSVGFISAFSFPIPQWPLTFFPTGYNPGYLRCYSDTSINWKNKFFVNYGIDDCSYQHPPVSVEEDAIDQKIIVYPNPVEQGINIQSDYVDDITIKLMDVNGVNHPLNSSTLGYFNLSHLIPGVYFLKIESSKQTETLHKIIKL